MFCGSIQASLHCVEGNMGCSCFLPAHQQLLPIYRVAFRIANPGLNTELGTLSACLLEITAQPGNCGFCSFRAGIGRQPAIRQFGSSLENNLSMASKPDGDWLLDGQRIDPRIWNVVPLTRIIYQGSGPQGF